jgi:hypothetical protein
MRFSDQNFVTLFLIVNVTPVLSYFPTVIRILVTFPSKQWCSITVIGRQVEVCCRWTASSSEWPNQPASSQVQRVPAPKPAASNVNTPSWWRSPGEMPSLVTHVQSTLVLIPPWCWLDPKHRITTRQFFTCYNVSICTVWRTSSQVNDPGDRTAMM